MKTTQTLTSVHSTDKDLAGAPGLTVTNVPGGYTVSFTDLAEALAAVERVKERTWQQYLAAGGNPRNKRAHSSQFASVVRALRAAAA